MRSELLPSLAARSEELLATGRFQNYIAQCHSRDVMRSMRTPEADWPQYTANLDEDLVYTAQYLLYIGMNLISSADYLVRGQECLTLGAEIIEHVYAGAVGSDDPERVTQLFTAALAYYMAGHFARAYVLVRDLESNEELPRFVQPLRHLLLKDFRQLRVFVVSSLLREDYSDDALSRRVSSGELGDSEAYSLVFEATLFRSLSYFLEHMKSGETALLETASNLLEEAIELAIDQRFADWWWYCSCLRSMLATYGDHSLWSNLQPLLTGVSTEPIAEGYIRANFRLKAPIVELWPSQRSAIPYLFDAAGGKSLCFRMPTSAGKTKVAELAILRFLTDFEWDEDAKCVYVAPFRALAVEVEQTLKDVFQPLGIRVSELYGGFELTSADRVMIERTHILVATPEKLDALFRFSPDLVGNIKLVVFDEGHIISEPDFKSIRQSRGLKYEVFLQRTVRRLESQGTRIVFLSAVMPNAEQFAEWITGDRTGLVSSDWRPSRLMVGEAVWDGTSVAIEYTHADYKPLGHRCFVRNFVTQVAPEAYPGRKRKAPLPRDGEEALALTALDFAGRGMTMVFVARKASAEPFGRAILECIGLRNSLEGASGSPFSPPTDDRTRAELDRCQRLIEENLGSDSVIGRCLRAGVVVHHGSLPQPVRLGLERLVRRGVARLVVATTTLAQGVNFPIRTVLVHSLDHGKGEGVSPMDFWNICGRAGRGMKENEGQVLFFVNDCYREWEAAKKRKFRRQPDGWKRRAWNIARQQKKEERASYLSAYGNYEVQSALLSLLRKVVALWRAAHPTVRIDELCEALADHRLDLFGVEEDVDLESLLSTFDGLALALTEGVEAEEITPELFEQLLERSLAFLQLESDAQRRNASKLFAARLRYVYARHPDATKRRLFYRLGLPLRDCERVDARTAELLALFLQAEDYVVWDVERRADLLAKIAGILFQLDELKPSSDLPECWKRLLALWLRGQTPTEIAQDPEVAACELTAHTVSRWIDDVCWYRLPWGYNMLSIRMKQAAEEAECELPVVCDYFSSLVKYGVHEPVACWLLTLGIQSRGVALKAARLVDPDVASPKELLEWLVTDGLEFLRSQGLDDESLQEIGGAVATYTNAGRRESRPYTHILLPSGPNTENLSEGTRLLLQRGRPSPRMTFRVLTLDGNVVGTYELEEPDEVLGKLLESPELASAVVQATPDEPAPSTIEVLVSAV